MHPQQCSHHKVVEIPTMYKQINVMALICVFANNNDRDFELAYNAFFVGSGSNIYIVRLTMNVLYSLSISINTSWESVTDKKICMRLVCYSWGPKRG